jgi:hypothetical protein
LQEEYADLKAQEQRMAKKIAEVTAENKEMTEPLALAAAEVAKLRHGLQHYEKVARHIEPLCVVVFYV